MIEISAYTDGGVRGNGKKDSLGGWSYHILLENTSKKGYSKLVAGVDSSGNATNNTMEMQAVIEAMKAIKNPSNVFLSIYSDSAYVVNCFNDEWYVGWQKRGWKNSKGKPVENRAIWEEMISLKDGFANVQFIKVKGHAGVERNEIVDTELNIAMDEYINKK